MKFARYLEDTQIPEWKKAYIDYRGLKKRITAIRLAQDHNGSTPLLLPTSPALDTHEVQTHTGSHASQNAGPFVSARESLTEFSHDGEHREAGRPRASESLQDVYDASVPFPIVRETDITDSAVHIGEQSLHSRVLVPTSPREGLTPPAQTTEPSTIRPGILQSATLNMGFLPRLRRNTVSRNFWEPSRRAGKSTLQWDLAKSIPLKDLMPLLMPVQRAFFEKLDVELDKIETFYVEREKEMRARMATLKHQLQELQDHGRVFHEAQNSNLSWLPLMRRKLGPNHVLSQTSLGQSRNLPRKRRNYKADSGSGTPKRKPSPMHDNKVLEEAVENTRATSSHSPATNNDTLQDSSGSGAGSGGSGEDRDVPKGWKKVRYSMQKHHVGKKSGSPTSSHAPGPKYDPDEYLHAKKRLKKAVLECYRGLEVLENYRTLNLIGFRKALKKFEKYTQIPAQQAYFTEKIEVCAFSSGTAVHHMISEMEDLYAARFTRGDKKMAKVRLRGDFSMHKTRHLSTFRTGLLLGLALPALVDGVFRSFQHDTREAIPAYNGVYYVFSVFLIPVLFSFLVGLNVLVWSRYRINYVFIFEMDLKTKLDHREYFETPALLLSTLCYAFWLSFARIGNAHFSPTLWPLIWLALVAFVLFNPFPVFFKRSRWWLLRNWARLLTSGVHRVEFADFWMGDQFCSLVFTLSNLYLVVCAYDGGLDETWTRCLSPRPWGVPFVLASLPLLARLVQSVKRWVDSKLTTHLINGGKYGAGIIYYLAYFNWRHHGGGRGGDFAIWCMFGTIYAIYASAWDFLMDWSVLRPRAKYPLLRPNLLYTGHISLYYFAIITNVLIRFIWVMYIPERGPSFALRTFIAGMLEMLRRWQWNFYRLENEHLGNVDQYRVTREVPLPYSYEDQGPETDYDEDDRRSLSSWRSKRKAAKAQALREGLTNSNVDDIPS